ncbi:MAG: radical SAM protein [Spirochaetales bacterium]|jgi:hypothetical protein|nr:radical SAM protein [Spirochaetales bacterium]
MSKPLALLINPPVYDFALFDLFHKPLGLMRIGKWLENSGFDIKIADALDYHDSASTRALGEPSRRKNGTGKFFRQITDLPDGIVPFERKYARYGIVEESFRERLSGLVPDVILITSGMTYWYPGVAEAAKTAKTLFPDTPIVIGGIYATLLQTHCRHNIDADHVVAGDAGVELGSLLGSMGLPVPVGKPDGRVLLDADIWRGAGVIRLNNGCPLSCDYCASRILCPSFTAGEPDEVFEIISAMASEAGVRSFAFYDDALLYRKEMLLIPLLERIIASALSIDLYTPNAIHIRYLDTETALLMQKAGFREVRMGFESSSDNFHEIHDGKVDTGKFFSQIEMLKRAGFASDQIIAYILAGLPGQYAAEVEESIRYVTSSGIRASVAEYSPVPGTALWKESVSASRYPIAEEPIYQSNSVLPMEWTGFSWDDMERLKKLSRQLFYGST